MMMMMVVVVILMLLYILLLLLLLLISAALSCVTFSCCMMTCCHLSLPKNHYIYPSQYYPRHVSSFLLTFIIKNPFSSSCSWAFRRRRRESKIKESCKITEPPCKGLVKKGGKVTVDINVTFLFSICLSLSKSFNLYFPF
ncbi:uncharacterized protein EV154DRAFT_492397 [Mucor mucedo]|uniref:uncharacterized protein n=1 Tax=Mucor mucedo TaxID=29922 RepID=UPI00221F6365|nr:uncharacterized protein EV154DRAFT_492397 [Mucor mucedo]KAI7896470.1 hypothetical protein EV154DRAFT_492397 [Mucor mucedo]